MPTPSCPVEELPQWTTDRSALQTLLIALRQDLVEETVYEDLEALLGEHASPTPDEAAALAGRFRRVVDQLVQIVPHRVQPYPVDEVRLVNRLHAERPSAQEARGHLRRFAMAILDVLDLMGETAR
ncbi:DUF6415 family natural product biosynthesis protein [Streptomyces sp. TP-A0356]|uniref:DUF6415 family natural product biosynthesis protein n=1 Tax=Streptomyces sp. TP-A0356 TaxID=1359208 RepID=UPI000A5279E7|nr:DUF6415 family natural product biosynthesis protein [Streptomyces sp. TP-A0356]